MNLQPLVAAFALLGTISSGGSVHSLAETAQSARSVKVYHVGVGVTAPEIRPADYSSVLRSDCRQQDSGIVRLSLIIDETGTPRNVFFVNALARSIDQLALQVVLADRFIPGELDGVPVAVAMLMDVKLEACVVADKTDSGVEEMREHLKSAPVQTLLPDENATTKLLSPEIQPQPGKSSLHRIGNGINPPYPIVTPEAPFPSDQNQWKNGVCLISLIVDTNGMPRSPKIARSLSPEMDRQALEAVRRYRFRPGTKNGQPVAVLLTIEVSFRR